METMIGYDIGQFDMISIWNVWFIFVWILPPPPNGYKKTIGSLWILKLLKEFKFVSSIFTNMYI